MYLASSFAMPFHILFLFMTGPLLLYKEELGSFVKITLIVNLEVKKLYSI